MSIHTSGGPKEVLVDDPFEAKFLRDTEEITAGIALPDPQSVPPDPQSPPPDPQSPPSSPNLPAIPRYLPVQIQKPALLT